MTEQGERGLTKKEFNWNKRGWVRIGKGDETWSNLLCGGWQLGF